jgi:hypothetical protein
MIRSSGKWVGVVIAAFGVLAGLLGVGAFAAPASHPAGQGTVPDAGIRGPFVQQPIKLDVSPALRDVKPIPPQMLPRRMSENELHRGRVPPGTRGGDPVVQSLLGPLVMPTPIQNFEGISNLWGGYPSDTNGEVGPNHYVQMVNVGFQIWNKTGGSLYGPADIHTLWTGFGGVCETRDDGDPVVLYDQLADRWLLSQFALPAYPVGPSYQCIAVSQSADPTGAYYRYVYTTSQTLIEDYPHLGVWPDGYYMTTNQFQSGAFVGGGAFAFDRAKMIAGQTAAMVYFSTTSQYGGQLPSDLDGVTPPPAGSPNYFIEMDDDTFGFPTDRLNLFKFHVDWTTPANSTYSGPTAINTAAFDSDLCGYDTDCLPQPGTAQGVDALADRLMFRVAYRNFGDHEALVLNHTVDVSGTDHAGIRWYELRSPNTTPTIYQQGTFAPDALDRWVASIAMDRQGNIGLGYNVTSSSVYPSIRYTGRLASDAPGTLPQGEATIINGSGAQTGPAGRWGDYSDLTVDPSDDCTFWYTTEYYPVTSSTGWHTRIGSFKFPQCGGAATPTPGPTITPGGPTPCPVQFVDVPSGSTFYDFVRCLACRGIVSGYPCGGPGEPCPGTYFRPGNNLTRGQVSKIVSESAGFSDAIPSGQQTFEDVSGGSTFWLWIERLAGRGILGGYACGGPFEPCVAPGNRAYFRPGNDVTRGQLSKIVANAAGWTETPTGQTFEDVPPTGTFYLFVERMAVRTIISGYPCGGVGEPCVTPGNRPYFRPNNSVTRGQASKMVANAFFPGCSTPARR